MKGWDLLLDSFSVLLRKSHHALFIFVGDGEDRILLNTYATALGLDGKVIITGFQKPDTVAGYINAADLLAVGSHKEGWSIAMLEALACGKNVVSTNISGASDMILEGVTGFIVRSRKAEMFATAIESALSMPDPNDTSVAASEKYALEHLQNDIAGLWGPLS